MNAQEEIIHKGLAGVIVDTTAISKVMPETNSLTYRGYAVQDLCTYSDFEHTAYLLIYGEYPDAKQLQEFQKFERNNRTLSPALLQMITLFPKNAHPMDMTRAAVDMLGMESPSLGDIDLTNNRHKACLLYAKLPTIVAAIGRHKQGLPPLAPTSLGYCENFLQLFFDKKPSVKMIKAFDVSMILYAEHSFNASTFTARVVTSTGSDIFSAVSAGISALKGPLHGGANEAVMHTMLEIGQAEHVKNWLSRSIDDKRLVMGFGHRVYKNGDSRVPTMEKAFFAYAAGEPEGKRWRDIYEDLAKEFIAAKGIYPNLDYPTGPTYYLMGFAVDMFTPLFVMSRVTGWSAHVIEQLSDNKLIRPLSAYNGVAQRQVPHG